MIHMRLNKHTCPLTNRRYFALFVTDSKSNRTEVLIADREVTIIDLVGSMRKLADRLEFSYD